MKRIENVARMSSELRIVSSFAFEISVGSDMGINRPKINDSPSAKMQLTITSPNPV